MDGFRGFENEAGVSPVVDEEPVMDRPPEIGIDERRMHVRAYNYWVSLLDGRPYPTIDDLDPHTIEDFGPHSVLLDFTRGTDDPVIAFLGATLRHECALERGISRISQVPSRSLLSRLTDHYLQIIANRAPIGFEAEFMGQRGLNTMYRGILMPLSSDGDSIDFIYGVINWKELADSHAAADLASQVDRAVASASPLPDCPVWADGPNADILSVEDGGAVASDGLTLSLWGDGEDEAAERVLGPEAGLGDRLCLARETAEAALGSEHRSRAALYKALGHAYDFALAAEAEPADYAEILHDAGLKAQKRAPMTPVVKLVFGANYDKTRLTEFAAGLCWAMRQQIGQGSFAEYLESYEGGLKGVVKAERAARRPAPRPGRAEEIRDRLRSAPAFAHVEVETDDNEFVLLLARKEAEGMVAVIAPVAADEVLLARAIGKSIAARG